MTACDQHVFSRYLDGELSLPERIRLERHVLECSACGSELAALRRVDRVVRDWASRPVPIPIESELRIVNSVERRKSRSRVRLLSRMMPAAVGSSIAALLVVTSASLGIYSAHPSPSGQANAAISQQIARQTSPLVAARRTSAIVGGRAPSLQQGLGPRTRPASRPLVD